MTYALAVGQADVRSRLVTVYLACHTLTPEDFPQEFQKDWQWIVQQLTRYGPILDYNGEVRIGSVEHTMRRIKNKTAAKIARKIYNLYDQLHLEKYSL
jgi:hypothetical protein